MTFEQDWIKKSVNLLRAIEFNFDHPSPMRKVIGGLEIDMVRALLREFEKKEE